jgi:ketosteroid isomerase-like protein
MAENVELIRRVYDAMTRGAHQEMAELFHEDAYWHAMATGIVAAGRTDGREAIFEMIGGVVSMFEPGSMQMTVTNLIGAAENNFVASEHTLRARFVDGTAYENHYAFIWEVRDGRVAGLREYMDSYYVHNVTPDRYLA